MGLRLGLGTGLSSRPNRGSGGSTSLAPGAVVLTWDGVSSDTTPNFDVDLPSGNGAPRDAAAGDVLRIQYSSNGGSSWNAYLTHTLDAGDIAVGSITVTGVSPLADGSYLFRPRLERGALVSAWGASESVTIDSGPANAEAAAWKAAVVGDGGTVSDARLTLVDDLITELKSGGVWSALERLWLFWSENAKSALRDIVAAELATAVSGPTFTTDRGYAGDGGSSYVDSNYNPSTDGVNYTQDSACLFVWVLTNNTDNSNPVAGQKDVFDLCIFTRFGGGVNVRANVNSSNSLDTASATTDGLWSVNRSGANGGQNYRNGASLGGSNSLASTGIGNSNIVFGRSSFLFSNHQFAVGGVCGSLDATKQDALYDALHTFGVAVGAVA
jgi:hypothetical protein